VAPGRPPNRWASAYKSPRASYRVLMPPVPGLTGSVPRDMTRRLRSARRERGTSRSEPFSLFRISGRLSVESPGYRISHAHPELRIEILNRMDVDPDHQLMEVRVLGRDAAQYADELRRIPGVLQVDVYSATERSAMYRALLPTAPAIQVLRAHRVLTRYPIVVQDGWARFETIATRSQIRRMLRDFGGRVGPARVEAVRRGVVRTEDLGLTSPQEAVFRAALQAGYFNAPRGVSLTELARRLGRSKSTVSEQLAKVQRRLAESALRLELNALPLQS